MESLTQMPMMLSPSTMWLVLHRVSILVCRLDICYADPPVFGVETAENVLLSWTDEFTIAGGNQSFSAGTEIAAITEPAKIKFQESVTLNSNFLLDPVASTPKLKAAFAFKNQVSASVYLYKQVSDSGKAVSKPFYITSNGPNPPGESVLTPKASIRLYFAKHYESGTMIDNYQSEYIDVDLTGRTSASVKYNAEGHWSEVKSGEKWEENSEVNTEVEPFEGPEPTA